MSSLTFQAKVHFRTHSKGQKRLSAGERPQPQIVGRVPRVSKVLALAIRFEGLVHSGAVKDYAELARLGHVSRARLSQIMLLLQLAPDIQEEVLFLPRIVRGTDVIREKDLRRIALQLDWKKQRALWNASKKQIATSV